MHLIRDERRSFEASPSLVDFDLNITPPPTTGVSVSAAEVEPSCAAGGDNSSDQGSSVKADQSRAWNNGAGWGNRREPLSSAEIRHAGARRKWIQNGAGVLGRIEAATSPQYILM